MTLLPLTAPIAFVVHGRPITQGSKISVPTGRGRRLIDGNDKLLRPWRRKITAAAIDASRYQDTVLTGPVKVTIIFSFDRPASHFLSDGERLKAGAPRWPISRQCGDVDKAARAVLDSITDASTVWVDDSQVVELRVRKFWAAEHELALSEAGIRVQIQEVAP